MSFFDVSGTGNGDQLELKGFYEYYYPQYPLVSQERLHGRLFNDVRTQKRRLKRKAKVNR